MFRWYAMDMTGMEYFRMTPKAVFFGLICTFGPAYVIWRLIVNTRVCVIKLYCFLIIKLQIIFISE